MCHTSIRVQVKNERHFLFILIAVFAKSALSYCTWNLGKNKKRMRKGGGEEDTEPLLIVWLLQKTNERDGWKERETSYHLLDHWIIVHNYVKHGKKEGKSLIMILMIFFLCFYGSLCYAVLSPFLCVYIFFLTSWSSWLTATMYKC